eukprot:13085009-Alexandrium_andersonii.AAC.1
MRLRDCCHAPFNGLCVPGARRRAGVYDGLLRQQGALPRLLGAIGNVGLLGLAVTIGEGVSSGRRSSKGP